MNSLYLLLDCLTVIFPIVLSFDKKVAFYKSWKHLVFGFLLVGIPFILWDIWFTEIGVWGFNADYLTGIEIINLPIEEILFFVVVPFACTFIYACVKAYFPKLKLTGFNQMFYAAIIIYAVVLLILGWGGLYTTIASVLAILIIPLIRKSKLDLMKLPLAFLISLLPFFLVNGILTGSFIDNPVVWYNDSENAGIRLFTIPVEDVVYGWTLIAGNIIVFEYFLSRKVKK